MLDLLHIENIAVIEQADVEFGPGLNVLTGETGAGKSIIIDAIGAILGGRTSKELVRTGTPAATISAEMSPSPKAAEWLRNEEIPFEPDEDLIIIRRITAEGKTSCRKPYRRRSDRSTAIRSWRTPTIRCGSPGTTSRRRSSKRPCSRWSITPWATPRTTWWRPISR